MDRRTFISAIASAGITTAVAGCASDDDNSDTASGNSDGDGGNGDSDDDGGVEILEHEVVEPDVGSYVEVHGKIENNTGEEQSYIEIEAVFYNADGERVDDTFTNVTDVPDGEVVQFELTTTLEPDEFEEYELETSTDALG